MGFQLLKQIMAPAATPATGPLPSTVVLVDVCNVSRLDHPDHPTLAARLQELLKVVVPTKRLYLCTDQDAYGVILASAAERYLRQDRPLGAPDADVLVLQRHDCTNRSLGDDALRCALQHEIARYADAEGRIPADVRFLVVSDDSDFIACGLCSAAVAHITVLLLPRAPDEALRVLPLAEVAAMLADGRIPSATNDGPARFEDPISGGCGTAPVADPARPLGPHRGAAPLAPHHAERLDLVLLAGMLLGTECLPPLVGLTPKFLGAFHTAWRSYQCLRAREFRGQPLVLVGSSKEHRLVLSLNAPLLAAVLTCVRTTHPRELPPAPTARDARGQLIHQTSAAGISARQGTTQGFIASLMRRPIARVEVYRAPDAALRSAAARGYLLNCLHIVYLAIRGRSPAAPPEVPRMPAILDLLEALRSPDAPTAIAWPTPEGPRDGPQEAVGWGATRYFLAPGAGAAAGSMSKEHATVGDHVIWKWPEEDVGRALGRLVTVAAASPPTTAPHPTKRRKTRPTPPPPETNTGGSLPPPPDTPRRPKKKRRTDAAAAAAPAPLPAAPAAPSKTSSSGAQKPTPRPRP